MNFYTNVCLIKNKIAVRAIEDGKRKSYKVDYRPFLFVPYKDKSKKAEFHTLKGEPVEKVYFESPWEQREFIKRYEGIDGFKYYGLNMPVYTYIYENTPKEIKYDASLIHVLILDIEVDSENAYGNPETADKAVITIAMRMNGKNLVFGTGDYTPSDKNTKYFKCSDEKEMLSLFLTAWNDKAWEPDIVTGWNVSGYDIPYLVNRIKRILGEESVTLLSPWRQQPYRREFSGNFGRTNVEYELAGISTLDYIQLYKKFSNTPRESYKLDYIAQEELKERKVDYSEYGSLNNLYKKDFQRFIDYNIHDVVLVERLEKLKGFISLVLAVAYDTKINYVDAFTTVRLWDIVIHNYLMDKKIVIPGGKNHEAASTIVGAYVKEPILGMHNWVVNFDLNSLYPHLIMQYNLSPETLVDVIDDITVDNVLGGCLTGHRIFENNVTVAAGGCVFTKETKGFLPTLMEKMYNDRLIWKKRMLEAKKKLENDKTNQELIREVDIAKNMQQALKIKLNGGYGALCNAGFRWFDSRLGEAITLSGQVSIRWVEIKMNKWLNEQCGTEGVDYVLASDTDSMYLRLDKFLDIILCKLYNNINIDTSIKIETLNKQCEEIFQPLFDEWYKELADYVHAYAQKMQMKREHIAEKGIWTAKKRYILNVWDTEGVRFKEPELKISGIETVRSSTPSACRKSIKDALKVIMNKNQDGLHQFIKNFREHYRTLPIEEIAFPRTCNGLVQYKDSTTIYKKGTPIAPKGGLIYNHWLKEKGLTNKYELIREGEKIKFVYLKVPNPLRDKVVSFMGNLPAELDLPKYIDYDTMYEKSFLIPIQNITNIIGWTTEKKNTLEDFFE